MKAVSFRFRTQVPNEARDRTLVKIRQWKGVSAADHIKRESRDPDIARMAFAKVDDDVDIGEVLAHFDTIAEVEGAEVPAQRRLVANKR